MKKLAGLTLVLWLAFATSHGSNGVEKIPWSALPPAVAKVAHAHIIRHGPAQKSTEDGEIFYDMQGRKNGRHVELSVAADGKLLSLEQEMDLEKIPARVQTAVTENSSGGKIGKIHKLTEDGEVSFVVDISNGAKAYELEFNPAGELQSKTEVVVWAQIPPAAQKSLKTEIGQSEVESFSKVTEDDEVSFVAQIIKGGIAREVSVSADGDLLAMQVALAETPMAVQKTIKEHLGSGKLEEINKTTESGEVFYEVDISSGGKSRSLGIAANGNLTDEEEEISLADAPAAVQKTIKSHSAGWKLETLTKRMEDGKVFYDVVVSKKGKGEEFSVLGTGELAKNE